MGLVIAFLFAVRASRRLWSNAVPEPEVPLQRLFLYGVLFLITSIILWNLVEGHSVGLR